ncbi:protein FAR1-RELATED SEQUENCE 5-like [Gossypium australe]|uniref:Protein FAR1-RELATED SEQUENCE n=1 Tax=Gossypium australe TaxID=47621 RepID=A0A5B6UVJ2_9ROSI|nr:protein FAR1-RELATED SEQUENCE 5-like [Gossypium australe]
MFGHAPTTIITDDEKAMGKATTMVLPNTTHRLYMCYSLQKLQEHLKEIICRYGLMENNWLQDLCFHRDKLVLAYLITKFCVGMSTIQRRENVKTRNFYGILKTCYIVKATGVNTYIKKMFLKFQKELFSSSQNLDIVKLHENWGEKIYRVIPFGKNSAYEVAFLKSNNKIICSCPMFEFVGILFLFLQCL